MIYVNREMFCKYLPTSRSVIDLKLVEGNGHLTKKLIDAQQIAMVDADL